MMQQQQQQPGQDLMKEDVQTVREAVDAVEIEDDDCNSIGDWSQAFLQALAFDEDLPPKFVSYRPYKGAKLRIFKLPGSLYGMSYAGTNGLVLDPAWMDERNRFIRSKTDKAVWHHPSVHSELRVHV